MKKLFRYADIIILVCATLALLTQLWIFLGGTDEGGLYPAAHPGWIIGWIFSAVVLIFTWIITRQVGGNAQYSANFPASIPAALGLLAGAIAMGIMGYQRLSEGELWLDFLCGYLGMLSALGLLAAGFFRLKGKQPPFACYMIPCFFLALFVFYLGREHGGEPEPVRYLFRFLATLSLIPACYQQWGFCVGLGQRRSCLFWGLLAGYLCILSAPVGGGGLVYILLGVWMLTNLCSLKYLPRRNRPAPAPVVEEPVEEPTTPEIPCTMEEDLRPISDPIIPQESPIVIEETELDVDSILADILREIDSNIT